MTNEPEMILMRSDISEEALRSPTFEELKVIAFKPELAHYLGSIEAALYFQQLLHWQKYAKQDDGYFYKSAAEMEQETCISERQQRRCRNQLERLGWIDTKKKMANGHPTYHFRVLVRSFAVLSPTGKMPDGNDHKTNKLSKNKKGPTDTTGKMPNGTGKMPDGFLDTTGKMPVPIGQNASSITKNTHKRITITSETQKQVKKIYSLYLIYFKINLQDYQAATEDEQRSFLQAASKRYRLTDRRQKKIIARIKDLGFPAVKQAVVNIGASDFHRGENDRGWKADLEWIFESYERCEKWANKENEVTA